MDPDCCSQSLTPSKRKHLRLSEPDFSTITPNLFPTFAKFKYASTSASDMQQVVDDTSAVVRALFSVNDTKMRENFWSYTGMRS